MSADVVGQKGVEMVGGLEQLLPVVDFLTIHTPLAASTLNLLGEKEFSLMKKSARVLNVVSYPQFLSRPTFHSWSQCWDHFTYQSGRVESGDACRYTDPFLIGPRRNLQRRSSHQSS